MWEDLSCGGMKHTPRGKGGVGDPLRKWKRKFIFEKEMNVPKLKTNQGAAKRFKKTGTGKIKAKRAYARHILTKKSANRKRNLRTPKFLEGEGRKGIEKLIPYL
jgi:large subunit ribosomal protein L35